MTQAGERVAIVGSGGLFPGAATLDEFWRNVRNGVDTSREVPPGRWIVPPERAYDPRPGTLDRVVSTRGYFLDAFEPDLTGFDIDPELVRDLDVLFHLALHIGGQAFHSARMDAVDRGRVGVVLGSIALPTERISDLVRETLLGRSAAVHALNRHVTGLPATLLAKALKLGGTAYTLDAACASSLYAIKLAVDELLSGRADAMLAGGLSRPDCLYTQMGFSQLRALSPSGRCSPFDAAGDGLVVGEGGGIFVLKRLSDALRHGDRILGVIAGIGLSNDIEGNLLSPASEGQLRAMRAAYAQAGWTPNDVDLIECHATGTPVGDVVEFKSLSELWGDEASFRGAKGDNGPSSPFAPRKDAVVLGSVKSTVGHLLTGANAAGVMKVLLALEHETLPPSANFHSPANGIDFASSPFEILPQAMPWTRRDSSTPRRAAVSGFGFGGINAHLLIEEWRGQALRSEDSGARLHADDALAIVAIGGERDDCRSHVHVPVGAFAIPPKEMEEMLPQQLIMLEASRQAWTECRPTRSERVGVFVGLSLDIRTTFFNLRWWASENGCSPDAASPPLTANRTMGALASIAASRIARAFRFGGPSFTVSEEDGCGRIAWEVACSMLRLGGIDCALVGEVEFSDRDESRCLEGATAFVVKRLADAQRDGDRIHAIVSASVHPAPDKELPRIGRRWLHAMSQGCYQLEFHRLLNPMPQYWVNDSASGPRQYDVVDATATESVLCQSIIESGRPRARRRNALVEAIFLFAAETMDGFGREVKRFASLVKDSDWLLADDVARAWWQQTKRPLRGNYRVALVVESMEQLQAFVRDPFAAIEAVSSGQPVDAIALLAWQTDHSSPSKVAFVYPGSGNHYHGMARSLGELFPTMLDRQQEENGWLRSQYAADAFWGDSSATEIHPRTALFAQVAVGTLVTDLLRSFGVEPDAAIGYSLGESASLFGLRVWRDRDGMFNRLKESTLFTSDLAPPYNAARTQWGWKSDQPIDWLTGVIAASSDDVQRAIPENSKVYVLIVNTPDECVIGGHRPHVEEVIRKLNRAFVEVRGVTAAHCEVARPVREAYRKLHHLPVSPLPNVRFYSGAWGEVYEPTSDRAADAITAAVLERIDFPKVIEAAWRDGIGTFIEIGPGNSCCRIIDSLLKGKPHTAVPILVQHHELENLLTALAYLHMNGKAIDLSPMYDREEFVAASPEMNYVSFPIRPFGPRLERMDVQMDLRPEPAEVSRLRLPDERSRSRETSETLPEDIAIQPVLFDQAAYSFAAVGAAHEAFLRFSTNTQHCFAETIALQTRLLEQGESFPVREVGVRRSLSFEQCSEFAAGAVGNVLGTEYAEADSFPTRVRLPDGPLMLVDRVLSIEGEPRSLTHGRVITEHRVHEDRWYLDGGRIPTCVAVEAGQADLFLSGFLGIDFVTRGLAVYRLLDAAITFHRPLPQVGETIRYDIHIDRFFRQGDTHLFRFRFEGTVNGEPLLTMTDGCAGFFTEEELASGKGVVQTALDRRAMPGKLPDDWRPLVSMQPQSFSANQIDALRQGDLAAAFGNDFAHVPLRSPMKLPGGMLKLVDRVTHLDPEGGRFGIGMIRAEADIHPDDWFLTCHFIDDMVMPGTLMYECCLHTLRIYLMRMGWIGEEGEVVCEPVPGVTSRLKCRGQVIASTKIAAYEVTIKEIGYGPEPYAVADALMYADGRPIVEMTNMSLRLSGLNREQLERAWGSRLRTQGSQLQTQGSGLETQGSQSLALGLGGILFDRERILAFAIGKPSVAFGEPYRIFDQERVIARLPGPPYQFLDRITRIDCEPWKMVAGGVIDAEYDVPTDEWYFEANRAPSMPFSILLEVALQPCGWLAAYVGSALTSDVDLSFRNLGGTAVQHLPVGPDIGTLTTTVKITRVSSSAGMIIQHYDFAVRSAGRDVYSGNTYFGFFTKDALANQVGLREFPLYQPSDTDRALAWVGDYPRQAPYPDSMLRMVDQIAWHLPNGGPHGLGAAEGRIRVDPDAWFFKAHFYQDPVWPGSLGLESFLQLARFVAGRRWGVEVDRLSAPAIGKPHQWVYRGQVLPTDREVTVQAVVVSVDDENREMTLEGLLSVDGRIIYRMTNFRLSTYR